MFFYKSNSSSNSSRNPFYKSSRNIFKSVSNKVKKRIRKKRTFLLYI